MINHTRVAAGIKAKLNCPDRHTNKHKYIKSVHAFVFKMIYSSYGKKIIHELIKKRTFLI